MQYKTLLSCFSTEPGVTDKFAPALCGYHGNNKKGSYQGHLFIEGKKDTHTEKEKEKKKQSEIKIRVVREKKNNQGTFSPTRILIERNVKMAVE